LLAKPVGQQGEWSGVTGMNNGRGVTDAEVGRTRRLASSIPDC